MKRTDGTTPSRTAHTQTYTYKHTHAERDRETPSIQRKIRKGARGKTNKKNKTKQNKPKYNSKRERVNNRKKKTTMLRPTPMGSGDGAGKRGRERDTCTPHQRPLPDSFSPRISYRPLFEIKKRGIQFKR
jgi:hypothetical protein